MQKVIFIAEEFFRSFRKSLFKDILLMIMFSTGLVMAVLMGSYYLELGQQYADSIRYTGNGIWYGISVYDDMGEIGESLVTEDGCVNMLEYYDELSSMEGNPIYSVHTSQGLAVREDDFKKILCGNGYEGFLHEDHSSAISAQWPSENEGQVESLLDLKSAQVDYRAYRIFALKTEEGEGFTEENTTIKTAADTIPIVLGNDYEGIVPTGCTFDINIIGTDYVYPCKVVGILEQGMQIPWDGDVAQDMITLDSYILFPYGIRILDKQAGTGDIERYAYLNALSLGSAAVRLKNEDEFMPMVNRFQRLGQEFGLPPVRMLGASMGLKLFRKESAAGVRIILILTIVLIFFTFYGLFFTLYDKVQANKRVYGIYLVNGCSVVTLIISYLLEISVILMPSLWVCRYVFLNEKVSWGADIGEIIRTGDCFAGVSFLVAAVFIALIMKGVNVEKLIRQKD